MEKFIFKLPEPYPEIRCAGNNQQDIQLIQPLYTGNASELSAILQYVYQHMVLAEGCEEVSNTIIEIAKIEMHHLALLGEAICTMGGNPKYVNPNTRNWWNTGAVGYEQNLCRALLLDLKGETDAHSAYLATARKVKNQSLAALLVRISEDEKLHMGIFTDLINCHCRQR